MGPSRCSRRPATTAPRGPVEPLECRRLLSGSLPGVPDVVGQFTALSSYADGLAFTLPESRGAPDASISNHYQGLVRYPGTGTPVFYVTQKDSGGGYIEVVRMGSRGTDGERLRSNLQALGPDTEDTAPPAADTWTRSIRLDGTLNIDGVRLPGYIHPGGMAIEDNILFVAMDTLGTFGTSPGSIVLFDLGPDGANRLNPVPIQVLPLNHKIDNLAVTRGADGRYTIWANGDGGSLILVYRTNGADLRANSLKLQYVQTWNPSFSTDYSGPGWPTGAGAHQSSTFVRQGSGAAPGAAAPLYMIATRHDGPLGFPLLGDDLADLYRVTTSPAGKLKLTFIKSYHPTLRYDEGGHLGNFAAASGTYVSPSGELILYSAPHNDEDKFPTDNVRIAELRHRDVVRPSSPLLQPGASAGGPYTVREGGSVVLRGSGTSAVGPWVQLFDDDHFGDRSLVVDYADRAKFELGNFKFLDNFGDKTSSVRWRLPIGMRAELFEDHNFGGSRRVLAGTGRVQEIADLGSFGDETSSMRFVGTDPADALTYAWDLDNDGVFGETGAAAAHGNEAGRTPTFVAGTLDGTRTVPIYIRVTDGTGATATSAGSVTVRNAPPAASVAGPTYGGPGQALSYTLSAADPSFADRLARFAYAVDFGDGTRVTYAPGTKGLWTGSTVVVRHAYAARGTYRVVVTATDKDGGVSPPAGLTVQITPGGLPPILA